MKAPLTPFAVLLPLLAGLAPACGGDGDDHGHDHGPGGHDHGEAAHDERGHEHGPEHDQGHDEGAAHDDGHEHEEVPLGTATVGDLEVELAQGHGGIVPGEEAHLVVKLPYSDEGATLVRAWLGTEDRTRSYVGKGTYAPGHDDYDVHATAPDPLPEGARWWIELERPDGTRLVGSAEPVLADPSR